MGVIKWITIGGKQYLAVPAAGGRFTTLTEQEALQLIAELQAALRTRPGPRPDNG